MELLAEHSHQTWQPFPPSPGEIYFLWIFTNNDLEYQQTPFKGLINSSLASALDNGNNAENRQCIVKITLLEDLMRLQLREFINIVNTRAEVSWRQHQSQWGASEAPMSRPSAGHCAGTSTSLLFAFSPTFTFWAENPPLHHDTSSAFCISLNTKIWALLGGDCTGSNLWVHKPEPRAPSKLPHLQGWHGLCVSSCHSTVPLHHPRRVYFQKEGVD